MLAALWFTIHLTVVQTWIVKKVAANLSTKLHTKVGVKHVDFSLFNKMNIQGVMVEDLKKDTLLYAGELNVNITDWFFLKDKATLHYIQLNDAVINMNRTDAVWNYQFLVDYFSSPKSDTTERKKGIQFDLKLVELNNFRFNQIDKWIGKDLQVSAKKLNLDAELLDFKNKNILINALNLEKPVVRESNYEGKRPPLTATTVPTANILISNPLPSQWNNAGWLFNVKSLTISDGTFNSEKPSDRAPYTDRFDGQHLLFTQINGNLKNIRLEKDTLTTTVNLSVKERSGLNVKKLSADIKFTPAIMEFGNLDLVLNNSHLKNYYAMKYNNFLNDMSDFIHNVTLEGHFTESNVSSDDIAIFAPALKSWKRNFAISGNASGTIDNLTAKKMIIKSGNTIVDGDIALRGLPDMKETFIDFKGNDVQTNYNDLVILVPALKNVSGIQLSKLGSIRYKGNFTGFINDFVTYGTFNTGLGTITGDLNMKIFPGKPALYSGKISTGGFKLGTFINNNQFGNIAVDGKISGSGFTAKDLKAKFDGTFKNIYFSGNEYQNITLDADFENKLFNGTGSINDPNLKVDHFTGRINVSDAQPEFNFDASVSNADLQKLKLTKDDFKLAGDFNINFTGSNIDNFSGVAKINGASLTHEGKRLSFDSLTLQSLLLADNKKQLILQSNEADATISGNFKILELPDAFSYFLSNYYPAYIKKPGRLLSKQDFDFIIHTKNIDEYTQLVDKKLGGFNNSTIKGNINLDGNELNLDAQIPSFRYDNKTFSDISLKGKGNSDSLVVALQTGDVAISDSLHFPGAQLNFTSHDDSTTVRIKTSASKTLNQAELNAQLLTYHDGVKIHFFPSSFIINDKKWQLEKDGELVIRNSVFDASEVKFVQDQQEIAIATEPSHEDQSTDIVVTLKKINILDFVQLATKDQRVEGLLSGTVRITNPFVNKKRDFKFENGVAENFSFNNTFLGNVNITDASLGRDNIIRFNAGADNDTAKFGVNVAINLGDSLTDKQIDIAFTSEHLDMKILEPYLGSIFSNMEGNAVSDLKITGNSKSQDITGSVAVTNGSFKVNYTQVKYRFSNETIIFNPGEIDFGTITLKDTLNNQATLSGKMQHHLFKDFNFDNIHLQSDRMLLMNTTKRDNSQFYGKIIGNATLDMNGPISNLRMNINGGPSTLYTDNNHIYLPTGSGKDVGAIDYIDFIKFGSLMENELANKAGTNIVVDMNLKANPACQVDVILDETTGDIIKGQGSGLLNILVGNKEPLKITGTYTIESGQYTFNFQQFVKKGFTLRRGGTISWNKPDPFDADIDLDAEYLAPNVDFSSFYSLKGSRAKSDVNIVAHLTNTLKKPEITFEFDLPDNSPYRQDISVSSKLTVWQRDPNEMNKQVSSVLIFNSFVSENQGLFQNQNPGGIVINTIGQLLFRNLTDYVNRYLQRAGITFNFDISSSNDLNGQYKNLQTAANVNVSKKILNGRVIFTLGGNLDYNNPYAFKNNSSNLLITPDFTAEFLLTNDGKLRVVAFRRTNTDFALGQRNRQGLSLTYRNDFDNVSELFDGKKKRAKKAAKKGK